MSYSLPKYYFQDIHPDVMDEIMHGMQEELPEPSWEEIDNWLNTQDHAFTESWLKQSKTSHAGTRAPVFFSCKRRRPTVISGGDFGSGSSIGRRGQIFMLRKRGNPNWGRSGQFPPAMATAFEMQLKQLRLRPDQYVASARLRSWCEKNKNQYYIPEWLLDEWRLRADADLSGAA